MVFQTIQDVHNYLSGIPNFQTSGSIAYKPGLESIRAFCESIGSPHLTFKSIQVAGTNGKGTTCSMLSAIFIKSGYKTGTYTSPHLLRFNERVKINGENCSDEALIEFFSTFSEHILKANLSYFELITAFGFWFFAKEKVDIAIVEVGLGGRLDATSILNPLCCAISSISLDHQSILGNTIRAIAGEKAGIIKKFTSIVIGDLAQEAYERIKEIALQNQAPFFSISNLDYSEENQTTFTCELLPNCSIQLDFSGLINIKNALLCLLVLEQVKTDFYFTQDSILYAFKNSRKLSGFKARFEKLRPELNWFFDGAHNEEALYWVKQILKQYSNLENCVCICSFMKDKDFPLLLSKFSAFKSVYYYDLNTSRSASFDDIVTFAPKSKELNESNVEKVLNELRNDIVIFTGSFYFYPIVDKWMSRFLD